MEADWLGSRLAEGRSIESIARQAGRNPSTVAYWVDKHGLTSTHAAKHAARGGVEREELEALVARGMAIRAMAEQLGVSYTTVRHWLNRYGLKAPRTERLTSTLAARQAGVSEAVVDCPTRHIRRKDGGMRCVMCRSEAVARRRRRQGPPRCRGRRPVRPLWLLRQRTCAALPSP
jgi:DNA-binding CsgD family transcriptional regulator